MNTKKIDTSHWDRLHIEADRRKPFMGVLPRRSLFVYSEYAWRKKAEAKVQGMGE